MTVDAAAAERAAPGWATAEWAAAAVDAAGAVAVAGPAQGSSEAVPNGAARWNRTND